MSVALLIFFNFFSLLFFFKKKKERIKKKKFRREHNWFKVFLNMGVRKNGLSSRSKKKKQKVEKLQLFFFCFSNSLSLIGVSGTFKCWGHQKWQSVQTMIANEHFYQWIKRHFQSPACPAMIQNEFGSDKPKPQFTPVFCPTLLHYNPRLKSSYRVLYTVHTHGEYRAERTTHYGENGPGRRWVIYVNHNFHCTTLNSCSFFAVLYHHGGQQIFSTLQLTTSRLMAMRGR